MHVYAAIWVNGTIPGMTPGSRDRRLGLEPPSQMVPPGSRQTLSTGPTDPSSGYGENTLGTIVESEPVRLPDLATVFARRAERLRALAEGHELEGFLRTIAALVAAQQAALGGLPPGALPGPAEIAAAKQAHRAPLDPSSWARDESWWVALARILEGVDASLLPEPARLARGALATMGVAELEALADRFLVGDVAAGEAARAVFVAAALQARLGRAWRRCSAQGRSRERGVRDRAVPGLRLAARSPG